MLSTAVRFPYRTFATLAQHANETTFVDTRIPTQMSAWQCLSFIKRAATDLRQELHLTSTRRIPVIGRPDHLLVRVECASLNPIDLLGLYGYGAAAFKYARCLGSITGGMGVPDQNGSGIPDFPHTPGRDFAGTVVGCGPSVTSRKGKAFSIGHRVAGATWPFLSNMGSGTLAEFIVCPMDYMAPIPDNVTTAQAVSIGYSGLTAWSALDCAGISPKSVSDLVNVPTVLVTGSSGGVGLIAAQLAQLWGARVHVTCRDDEKTLKIMKELDFEEVIVYPDRPAASTKYDVIIDCVPPRRVTENDPNIPANALRSVLDAAYPKLPAFYSSLKPDSNARYVSLNSPLLSLMDQAGVLQGAALSTASFVGSQIRGWVSELGRSQGQLRWAFFCPSGRRLAEMLRLTSTGQLRVYVDSIFPFSQVPEAFDRLQSKGVRCKVVVQVQR